jgi:hypothetical protein
VVYMLVSKIKPCKSKNKSYSQGYDISSVHSSINDL